jgi:hypothetical protein
VRRLAAKRTPRNVLTSVKMTANARQGNSAKTAVAAKNPRGPSAAATTNVIQPFAPTAFVATPRALTRASAAINPARWVNARPLKKTNLIHTAYARTKAPTAAARQAAAMAMAAVRFTAHPPFADPHGAKAQT